MAQQRSLALEVGLSVSGLDTFYSECGDGWAEVDPGRKEEGREGNEKWTTTFPSVPLHLLLRYIWQEPSTRWSLYLSLADCYSSTQEEGGV